VIRETTRSTSAAGRAASAGRAAGGQVRSDVRSLAKGGVINLVASGSGQAFAFLMTVVVTRGLGARGAGAFFEVVGLFTILSNSVRLGADTGMVRAVSSRMALRQTADLRRLVRVAVGPVLVAGVLIAAVTWAFGPWLAGVFLKGVSEGEGTTAIRVLAFFLPLVAVTIVALSGTRGFGTMLPYAMIENFGKPLARLILVAGVLAVGLGSVAALVAWAIPVAVGFVAALWILLRLVHQAETGALAPVARPAAGRAMRGARRAPVPPLPPIATRASRHLASQFWRFAAPRGIAGVFQVTVLWLDVLLVGALRSTREAGIYAAASKLAMVGTLATEAVRIAIAPQISSLLTRREHARAEGVYQVATWWIMTLCWPLYLALMVFGAVVLRIFGAEFAAGSTALLVLSAAMLVDLATGNVTVMLLMGGKSSWNLLNALGAVILNIGLNLLLLPRIGITGAAIAWAASILLENVAAMIELRILLRLNPFGPGWWLAAGQATLCFAGLGLLARTVLGNTVPSLVIFGLVATPLYLWLVWRVRGVLQLDALREAIRARRGASPDDQDAPQEAT
jgi:O-antigen/teichoic acid export membrane protein